jgi:hypothetical protein
MKNILTMTLLLASAPAAAQNSLYQGAGRDYEVKSVYVGGEVESPGLVDLAALPQRSAAVKELAWEEGKPVFKGAYFFTGYSLYDILEAKKVKKAREDFHPEVDLFVAVENEKGDKAVFSWGEVYYARNNFQSLIYRSARSITPGKKKTDWPLPEVSRLVCADDLYNARFIENPSKITVMSAPGNYPGEKHKAAYAPAFQVVKGAKAYEVKSAGKAAKREYLVSGYGHGTGFKEVKEAGGFLFKDALEQAGINPQESAGWLAVVSAGDAYRAVFSLSEIVNRGDNADFIVQDKGKEKDGRFALFSTADFFVDRNVRSLAKVELLKP